MKFKHLFYQIQKNTTSEDKDALFLGLPQIKQVFLSNIYNQNL